MTQKCGFVAILGEPNAGKSTLTNALVGQKVSIISPKVQTTRQKVLGIAIEGNTQLILMDTPGIFAPKKRLDRAMVAAAWEAQGDADVIIIMVDASEKRQDRAHQILSQLEQNNDGRKKVLVINKIDLLPKDNLLALACSFQKYQFIEKTFMISALKNDGILDLRHYLAEKMPQGPWLFPEDQITDLPQRLWASEITREQLYHHLKQELPYETYVETEAWEEFKDGSVKINQVIYVNKSGQKSILLGKGGQMIKNISQRARAELSYLLDRPVHLFIHVKVSENWGEKSAAYKLMGLNFTV